LLNLRYAAIDYVRTWNRNPKPFSWTIKASALLKKVRRASIAVQNAGSRSVLRTDIYIYRQITPPKQTISSLLKSIFGGGATTGNRYWDVAPDGQHFLINTVDNENTSTAISVVLNWQAELKR